MAKLVKNTTVVTNKVRLGYVELLEPKAFEGQEPKYSAQVMIPKEDTETVNFVKEAIKNAYEAAKGETLKGVKPAGLKTSFRDGDEELNDDGEPKLPGHYFINVSSKRKPAILKVKNGVRIETNDPEEIYSGVYAYVSINMYPYNVSGSKGIAGGLNNVLTLCKGDRFGGGISADEAFGDIEIEDEEDDNADSIFG
ncbi:DUF2815 family protein [Candidatus Enterococcus clewellii]|uniref:Phage protein n=1 Tax=Candidatus Enterococcus clewellii TaxID=1834193 RepID=A0A242K339_9ENTE|nr:DUF2815 family protein [Enterococcus sp. 9E7_DIV0242]OTP13415.1 hypothetical protein A5888_002893 [Enterococcus sp. 9E7_DIV0242]